uniref:Uncharacterized protein n=1 Tax=Anguilla anguilla TaxID=7936 RepID=A0A0E9PHG5_ANGAN
MLVSLGTGLRGFLSRINRLKP